MSVEEIRDTERVAAERGLGFIKRHVELLEQAFQAGDLHTADMLCTLIGDALLKVHQYVKKMLYQPPPKKVEYSWEAQLKPQ